MLLVQKKLQENQASPAARKARALFHPFPHISFEAAPDTPITPTLREEAHNCEWFRFRL